ncbi:MAG TPA: hypothetical protein VIR00_10925 [Micromonosporaceae bacterium]
MPLPPDAGPDETSYMLADSGATLLVREAGSDGLPVPLEVPAARTATGAATAPPRCAAVVMRCRRDALPS